MLFYRSLFPPPAVIYDSDSHFPFSDRVCLYKKRATPSPNSGQFSAGCNKCAAIIQEISQFVDFNQPAFVYLLTIENIQRLLWLAMFNLITAMLVLLWAYLSLIKKKQERVTSSRTFPSPVACQCQDVSLVDLPAAPFNWFLLFLLSLLLFYTPAGARFRILSANLPAPVCPHALECDNINKKIIRGR